MNETEPTTAKELIAKLQSVIDKLGELPDNTIVRQYQVLMDGQTAQIGCEYSVVSGNENKDVYYNTNTYLTDPTLEQVSDSIAIMYVAESD